ncbi:MAG: hypothetical protein M5U14_03405 [Acidimicrobiia bacterium]|nr:hypothetical protein [Acidimicrobiia bacterium]
MAPPDPRPGDEPPSPLPPRSPRSLLVHWAIDAAVAFLVVVIVAMILGASIWLVAAVAAVAGAVAAPATRRAEERALAVRADDHRSPEAEAGPET